MLIKQETLRAIEAGEVEVVYRWWKSARVREGTKVRTAIGLVEVRGIEELADGLEDSRLTREDAARAGFASRQALLEDLQEHAPSKGQADRRLFRIELRAAGADPRLALRQETELAEDEFAALAKRVRRFGQRSADGAWGVQVLELIARRPATLAAELASEIGMPVRAFKPRVRQLKELGLTESLQIGYRLSPRGEALLDWLESGA